MWAAIAVVAHLPGGLAIHATGWRFWTPYESVLPWVDGRPFDEFTVGYWMGLFADLALAPLRCDVVGKRAANRHLAMTASVCAMAIIVRVAVRWSNRRTRVASNRPEFLRA